MGRICIVPMTLCSTLALTISGFDSIYLQLSYNNILMDLVQSHATQLILIPDDDVISPNKIYWANNFVSTVPKFRTPTKHIVSSV